MNRAEHLQWCKDRANQYVDNGDTSEAFASFTSDMTKHKETAKHIALQLGISLYISGNLSAPSQMKDWINGFN